MKISAPFVQAAVVSLAMLLSQLAHAGQFAGGTSFVPYDAASLTYKVVRNCCQIGNSDTAAVHYYTASMGSTGMLGSQHVDYTVSGYTPPGGNGLYCTVAAFDMLGGTSYPSTSVSSTTGYWVMGGTLTLNGDGGTHFIAFGATCGIYQRTAAGVQTYLTGISIGDPY